MKKLPLLLIAFVALPWFSAAQSGDPAFTAEVPDVKEPARADFKGAPSRRS